jgi:1,4-alpha-glucan branching enzyme
MSDPINWERRKQPGHSAVWSAVRDLVRLRVSHPALQRNEIEFFYFHPSVDDNGGVRVFAYARTGGRPLGTPGQVAVVANCGPHDFPDFVLPWPWTSAGRAVEHGMPAQGAGMQVRTFEARASLSLAPFQVRVFALE